MPLPTPLWVGMKNVSKEERASDRERERRERELEVT